MTTQTGRDEYFATHPATKKQVDFITSLLEEIGGFGPDHLPTARNLYLTYAELYKKGEFTMDVASRTIASLKSRLVELKGSVKVEWPEVPTGRYAYAKSEDPEDLAFFHVVVKEDGFPLLWSYASDDELPIKGHKQKITILKKIVELGPLNCELLFGQKMGYCSRCGKKLTRTESRDRGMGDKCAGKY